MTVHNIEELIQRQFRQWELYRQMQREKEEAEDGPSLPVITISRELGAGARGLADALARRLDLQIHGISLIDHIAQDKNLERRIVDRLDESVCSRIDLWVQGILNRRLFMHDEYHLALVKAVKMLAANGGVLILGRGANVILEDACSLRLRVVASIETRIRNVMAYEGVDADAARDMIHESDDKRTAFLRETFHVEVDDPHHYDLALNTDRTTPEGLALVAMAALEARGAFAVS